MTKVEGAKPGGNNLLKEFAMTFQKGNGAIGFGECIVRFLWFRDNDNLGLTSQVKMKVEGRIPKK